MGSMSNTKDMSISLRKKGLALTLQGQIKLNIWNIQQQQKF